MVYQNLEINIYKQAVTTYILDGLFIDFGPMNNREIIVKITGILYKIICGDKSIKLADENV